MFSRKLNSIDSIRNLQIQSIKLNKHGSVKVLVKTHDGREVSVSRNQFLDTMERLVKKALQDEDPKAIAHFLKLKEVIRESETTTKVKRVDAIIRRFFGNLFRNSRESRLEKMHEQLQLKLLRSPKLPPMPEALRTHFIKRLAEENIETSLNSFAEVMEAVKRTNNQDLLAQFLQFYKSSGLENQLLQQAADCLREAGISVELTPENFSQVLVEVQEKDYIADKLQFFIQSLAILSHLEMIYGR